MNNGWMNEWIKYRIVLGQQEMSLCYLHVVYKTAFRHVGHCNVRCSQPAKHGAWKRWPQGSRLTDVVLLLLRGASWWSAVGLFLVLVVMTLCSSAFRCSRQMRHRLVACLLSCGEIVCSFETILCTPLTCFWKTSSVCERVAAWMPSCSTMLLRTLPNLYSKKKKAE